jgi:hypothetical protein
MGGSGGGGTTTNTVTKSDPWAGQQSYLTTGFQQALNNYNSDSPSYYPDSTVAPQSATTQTAQSLQAQRALNGSPLQTSTDNMLNSTISGDYLNSNPYLDANFNAGAQSIVNNYKGAIADTASNLSGQGRYGSGAQNFADNQANTTLANSLGNLYTNTYYNNYNTERGNQLTAAGQAPTMINQDYTDLSKLSDVGTAQDTYNQSLTDANVDKWNYNQNLPYNKLAQYMGLINGSYGMSSTTSTPVSGSSTLGNVLGGVATGLGAYSALK